METNKEIEHRKQKEEEERKARAREEELKFEREQMEMKLEFERQLEETKAKQQPVEKANQSEKGQQSYRNYTSQSLMGRLKHGCRSGTNFKLKLIQ